MKKIICELFQWRKVIVSRKSSFDLQQHATKFKSLLKKIIMILCIMIIWDTY